VFVKGRVSEEDDNASKLICENIVPFEETRCELWIQFADKETYLREERMLFEIINEIEGKDGVVIYLAKEKAVKRLPANRNIRVDRALLEVLYGKFGESRVKVVEKSIEIK
jgi:DNA polymerase-3 subunit alpha